MQYTTGILTEPQSSLVKREPDSGDKRLTSRLIPLARAVMTEAPETSINEASEGWSETVGSISFFSK